MTSETPRPRRWKWTAGITFILVGIGGLAAWAIAAPDAVAYYKTPTEALTTNVAGQNLRVGGRVADGSLVREGTLVRFVVTDGAREVPVVYHGDVPDTLKDRTDVIAEGRLRTDGTLVATRVMAKCSSKYVPAEDADQQLGRG